MYHPTTRVLTILELLQTHPYLSGAELARRLEVDRRTVRRYVQMLQELGIPIVAERGPHGGYRLRPGFKMPPLMLTDEEALAVTISLIGARSQGGAVEPHTIAGALAKIERVLPQTLRDRLRAVQTSVKYGAAPQAIPVDSGILLMLSSAIQHRTRVRMTYGSASSETERSFDPYGLVYHWDRWFAVGWCHLRTEIRVFRLDRIVSARPENCTFERPDTFDSLQHVHRSLATTPWGWEVEVLLDTTVEAIQPYVLPGIVLMEQAAEGVILYANVDNLDWMAWRLLALPCECTVRRPPELKQALADVAAHALAMAAR